MLDIDQLRLLLLEEQHPYFEDEQLEAMCNIYDDIYQAAYIGCLQKARVDKIKIAVIEIESNASFWIELANSYKAQWEANIRAKSSASRTGRCIGRADEL